LVEGIVCPVFVLQRNWKDPQLQRFMDGLDVIYSNTMAFRTVYSLTAAFRSENEFTDQMIRGKGNDIRQLHAKKRKRNRLDLVYVSSGGCVVSHHIR